MYRTQKTSSDEASSDENEEEWEVEGCKERSSVLNGIGFRGLPVLAPLHARSQFER
jgi:hypothetical protein